MTRTQLEALEADLRERAKPVGDRQIDWDIKRLAKNLADVVLHIRASEDDPAVGGASDDEYPWEHWYSELRVILTEDPNYDTCYPHPRLVELARTLVERQDVSKLMMSPVPVVEVGISSGGYVVYVGDVKFANYGTDKVVAEATARELRRVFTVLWPTKAVAPSETEPAAAFLAHYRAIRAQDVATIGRLREQKAELEILVAEGMREQSEAVAVAVAEERAKWTSRSDLHATLATRDAEIVRLRAELVTDNDFRLGYPNDAIARMRSVVNAAVAWGRANTSDGLSEEAMHLGRAIRAYRTSGTFNAYEAEDALIAQGRYAGLIEAANKCKAQAQALTESPMRSSHGDTQRDGLIQMSEYLEVLADKNLVDK